MKKAFLSSLFVLLSLVLFSGGFYTSAGAALLNPKGIELPKGADTAPVTSQILPAGAQMKNNKTGENDDFLQKPENLTPEPKFVAFPNNQEIVGSVPIKVMVDQASQVEFYIRKPQSLIPIYLGQGSLKNGVWEFSLNSSSVPNGQYTLFLKIRNAYGEYETGDKNIMINNSQIEDDTQAITQVEKRVAQAQQQIKQREKNLLEQEKAKKEKIVQLHENFAKEVQNLAPTSKASDLASALQQQVKHLPDKIQQFSQKTQEEAKIQMEIADKTKQQAALSHQREKLARDLSSLQKIKVDSAKAPVAGALKDIQQDKARKLQNIQAQEEQMKETVSSLRQKLNQIQQDKKKIKEEIKGTKEITHLVQSIPEKSKQAQLSKKAQAVAQAVDQQIASLEQSNLQEEKIIHEKTQELTRDSDQDGLSDAQEIMNHTDPLNPDTDGDGYLDGVEMSTGFDPLNPDPAKKIVYEEPVKSKAPISNVYQITGVQLSSAKKLEIRGKGLPNSFVTIYIYSMPLVLITKTDDQGNFSYILDKPLADGVHKVYVAVTNNEGKIQQRSEVFNFVKTPVAVAAVVPSDVSANASTVLSSTERLQRLYTILIIILIFSALSTTLIIMGLFLNRKQRLGN